MGALKVNSSLRLSIDDLYGLYRVVAMPVNVDLIYVGYIGPVDDNDDSHHQAIGSVRALGRRMVESWIDAEHARVVEVMLPGKLLKGSDQLEGPDKAAFLARINIMSTFLDQEVLTASLLKHGKIGPLVRAVVAQHGCSRASVHPYWALLCIYGLESCSLYPRFERCGAPGVLRPTTEGSKKVGRKSNEERLGLTVKHPQVGVTETMRRRIVNNAWALMKPGKSFSAVYPNIIERCFVESYFEENGKRMPVMPPKGSFPNKRQTRYIIETEFSKLERLRHSTTEGHYQRNLRGLHGRGYEGVAGPGHCYAIDATIGDIFLRSSINRAWIIGRPVVYIVVDVWSSAVVGFHLCLTGPSWDSASEAVFACSAPPSLLAELWGYTPLNVLYPAPSLPVSFLADRGEYLSERAKNRGNELGFNWLINPAYRPDYKGHIEVQHRIVKGAQFSIVPGAIDRRRAELELQTGLKDAALT